MHVLRDDDADVKSLHVSSDLRYAESGGRIVLLDLRTERYFALDPVASAMWKTLATTGDRDETFRALQERFAVDPARLGADLDAYIARCLESGFLMRSEPELSPSAPPGTPGGSGFLTVRAWWALRRTARGLRSRGFGAVYREYASLPKSDGADPGLLERAVAAFARAENFFHLRKAPEDCLPRSLALFSFLRMRGLPAEHRIGVQAIPFLAHAWVECDGRVVHDDPSNPQRFSVIARI